jgi:hypothetical protein
MLKLSQRCNNLKCYLSQSEIRWCSMSLQKVSPSICSIFCQNFEMFLFCMHYQDDCILSLTFTTTPHISLSPSERNIFSKYYGTFLQFISFLLFIHSLEMVGLSWSSNRISSQSFIDLFKYVVNHFLFTSYTGTFWE